jgi:hypothetical protein
MAGTTFGDGRSIGVCGEGFDITSPEFRAVFVVATVPAPSNRQRAAGQDRLLSTSKFMYSPGNPLEWDRVNGGAIGSLPSSNTLSVKWRATEKGSQRIAASP